MRRGLPEEAVIWEGCPSQVTKLGTYLLCGIVIGLGMVGAIVLWQLPVTQTHHLGNGLLLGLLLLVIVTLGVAAWNFLLVHSQHYTITTERILVTTGLLNRHTEEIELYRVRDASFLQPLLLRLFRLSHLTLMTTDLSSPTIVLDAIPDARNLWNEIRHYAEIARQQRGISEIDFT